MIIIVILSCLTYAIAKEFKPCGCIEPTSLQQNYIVAFTIFPITNELEERSKCNNFCKGNDHFTLTPWVNSRTPRLTANKRTMCKCYHQLRTFDCEEEVGGKLVKVHCKEEVDSGHDNMDLMAMMRRGEVFQDRRFTQDTNTTDEEEIRAVIEYDYDTNQDSSTSPSVTQGGDDKEVKLGLTALILGLLALFCIVILAANSLYRHRKDQEKAQKSVTNSDSNLSVTTNLSSPPSGTSVANSTANLIESFRPRLMSLSAGPYVYEKH